MRETNKKKSMGKVIFMFFCLLNFFIGCGENKLEKEKAVEPLIKALKDKNFNIRYRAAGALGKIYSKVK